MEPYSKIDPSAASGTKPVVGVALNNAALAGAALSGAALHPPMDGGRSLAEMAQRDLDAALQLLADRAQYITGASGAAIALRRSGKKDMLCRASAGSNAPELGALLSTEFGLSGESVRTRQPLRCDDAERDIRVNREVCRQMGIASVVVMPVVNDDEVLGVFELFSGKANAFGARDVSAVQRLSEMVETAVRLARAAETLPQRLQASSSEGSATELPQITKAEIPNADVAEDEVLEGKVLEEMILEDSILEVETEGAEPLADAGRSSAALEAREPVALQDPIAPAASVAGNRGVATAEPAAEKLPVLAPTVLPAEALVAAPKAEGTEPAVEAAAPAKKLFWSAATNPAAEAVRPEELDQSHVPPVLRNLRKCEACGFPVSAGRSFCVECEEKKWRGQLKAPHVAAKGEVRAFAAAAQSAAASSPGPAPAPMPSTSRASAPVAGSGAAVAAAASRPVAVTVPVPAPAASSSNVVARETRSAGAPASSAPAASAEASRGKSPEFVLSAGMQPSQSWTAAHKYILAVLLVIGGAVAAVFLLR